MWAQQKVSPESDSDRSRVGKQKSQALLARALSMELRVSNANERTEEGSMLEAPLNSIVLMLSIANLSLTGCINSLDFHATSC